MTIDDWLNRASNLCLELQARNQANIGEQIEETHFRLRRVIITNTHGRNANIKVTDCLATVRGWMTGVKRGDYDDRFTPTPQR